MADDPPPFPEPHALWNEAPFRALQPLGRVARLANFRAIAAAPPAIAVEDHRAVLVAAWAARAQGAFGSRPPLLVRFDAHPDLGEKPRDWAWEESRLRTVEDALSVANEQRVDDGGWACSALQFGLASGAATFFVHDYHRFPGDDAPLRTHRGVDAPLWCFPGVAAFLASDSPKARSLRRALDDAEALWIDIDLDFATARIDDDGRVRLWSGDEWRAAFAPEVVGEIARWMGKAVLATFSSEPEFCLGWEGAGRIAAELRRHWPDGSRFLARL